MATLQDYLGITKLRDAWPKWKANVIAVNNQVINHVAGTTDKHAAQDITYSGSFTSMADIKAALDQAKTEMDTIVVNASVDPEVALARESSVKSETFATLGARLEGSEQDRVSDKAETASRVGISISDYPIIIPESDDAGRFTRAIAYLVTQGGGTLQLDFATYTFSTGIVVPDKVRIIGRASSYPSTTTGNTLLLYTGTSGALLNVQSYQDRKAFLSDFNIICSQDPIAYPATKGICVLDDSGAWGGSCDANKISVFNFGIGVLHAMSYQCNFTNMSITLCGIGVSFNPSKAGVLPSGAAFGNCNVYERSNIRSCNIGVEFGSDAMNVFKNCDIENNYIAIQLHKVTTFPVPNRHCFVECWLENNGKDNPFTAGDQADRYVIANSDVDADFTANNVNAVSINVNTLSFVRCYSSTNVNPEIPSFNANCDLFHTQKNYYSTHTYNDESMTDIFNKTQENIYSDSLSLIGNTRYPLTVSNKGFMEKRNINGITITKDYTPEGAGAIISQKTINIGDTYNPDWSTVTPNFSGVGLLSIFIKRLNGNHANAIWVFHKIAVGQSIYVYKIGETLNGVTSIVVNSDGLNLMVVVTGDNLEYGTFKVNYLPNGIMAATT